MVNSVLGNPRGKKKKKKKKRKKRGISEIFSSPPEKRGDNQGPLVYWKKRGKGKEESGGRKEKREMKR